MLYAKNGLREKLRYTPSGELQNDLKVAQALFLEGNINQAMDVYDILSAYYKDSSYIILEDAYNHIKEINGESRYISYQSRFLEFNIKSVDKVLDIGSGHLPFPVATHLAEFAITDNSYGRAGLPFKYIESKPVIQCNVENMPFEDKEFDFIYCSHVLEHVEDPEKACRELMRVGKRGYIETPTAAKDMWLGTASISNHRWMVECEKGKLAFKKYDDELLQGLQCDVLLSIVCSPQSQREKALTALMYLKADLFHTMFLWEDKFEFEIEK